MDKEIRHLLNEYLVHFDHNATHMVVSPGRVNLIGEYTDFNQGYVLPMAINRSIRLMLSPRTDSRVRLYSLDFNEMEVFDLMDLRPGSSGSWIEYAKGVAHEYSMDCKAGFDGIVSGDIPIGAGLSSSAAIELAMARGLCLVNQLQWKPKEAAFKSQSAENRWVGVNCGIMDQMICALGEKDHAIMIDCRDHSFRKAKLPSGTSVVIMDTGTRRELVNSAYNDRRSTCESAANLLNLESLRDISSLEHGSSKQKLSEKQMKRVRHVTGENRRVLCSVEAMEANDAETLGRLMNESHDSLRLDFEVSSKELDLMVKLAQEHPACYGARMTGAGFGGAAVALVKRDGCEAFIGDVSSRYQSESMKDPSLFATNAQDGCRAFERIGEEFYPVEREQR